MTMKKTHLSALLATVLVGAMVACGQTTGDSQTELDLALHQEYGALSEADEESDFGDEDLSSAEDLNEEEDTEVSDDTANSDADVAEAEADPALRKMMIAVMWGQLRPRPMMREITDWTGHISIDNGALRVLRTLRFERGDHLVRRPNAHVVPFVSKTAPHADGLLLEVILHPRLATNDGPPTLSIETAAYSDSLVLQPGMRLSRAVRVDDLGNAVAYHIFRPNADEGCTEGLMVGRYVKKDDAADGRALGVIKGKYLSFDGSVAGKIKGLYGERQNGKQVFFAKVIKRNGDFRGILAGRWGEGKYKGRYLAKNRMVTGVVQGIYREGRVDDGNGFFMGRWSVGCNEISTEGETEDSDEDNTIVEQEVTAE